MGLLGLDAVTADVHQLARQHVSMVLSTYVEAGSAHVVAYSYRPGCSPTRTTWSSAAWPLFCNAMSLPGDTHE
jgi:hypothetical protein